MPISWNTDLIDTLVSELRTNEDSYTFLLANFGGRVAGMNTWKFEVLSGAKKPSEVLSKSIEALLLLILLNYWKAWEAQMHNPQQQSKESSTMSGSVSSISTASVTLYIRNNNSSTKNGSLAAFRVLSRHFSDDVFVSHHK